MGAWAGHHIAQETFLGWMSNAEGWDYFVNKVLPDVATGSATVGPESGSNLGANAPLANVLQAVESTGTGLGKQIPQSIMDQINTPPAPPAPTTPITPAADTRDAKSLLKDYFDSMGLGSEADWAWDLHTQGLTNPAIMIEERKRDAYKTRFSGVIEHNKNPANGPAISELDALSYEKQMQEQLTKFGIPPGAYSQQTIEGWIGQGKSVSEQTDRIKAASDLQFSEPPEVRSAIERLYGIHEGDLTAWALDQETLPAIQRKIEAGQMAASAQRTGFGTLNAQQAGRMADLANPATAGAEMTKLATQNQLYIGLPGEGGDFSLDQVIAGFFGGDANIQNEIRRRAAQRQAAFQGGGNVSQSQLGAYGAGVAGPDIGDPGRH